jgi:hypothetical protein
MPVPFASRTHTPRYSIPDKAPVLFQEYVVLDEKPCSGCQVVDPCHFPRNLYSGLRLEHTALAVTVTCVPAVVGDGGDAAMPAEVHALTVYGMLRLASYESGGVP